MEHLISEITLNKEYSGTINPVDDSVMSDLTNAVMKTVTYSFSLQNTTTLRWDQIDDFVAFVELPIGSEIDVSYGTNFRVTLKGTLLDFGAGSNCIISIIPVLNSSPVGVTSNYVTIGNGLDQDLIFDFNSGSFAFDAIWVSTQVDYPGGTVTVGVKDVSMVGTDVLDYAEFNTGDRIIIYWDDVSESIVCYLEDNPGATLTLIGSGPDLGELLDSQFTNWHLSQSTTGGRPNPSQKISNYAFCEGNDKSEFWSSNHNPTFPYFTKVVILNSPYCVINPDPDDPPIVCDIQWVGTPVIVQYPTNEFAQDGQIQVEAESSHADVDNPIVYYTTTLGYDIPYNSGGNSTGLITGLGVGEYDVYAQDKYNCKIVRRVKVLVDPNTYNTLYRQEFKDIQDLVVNRIDIQQSQYVGVVQDECSDGAQPFVLNKPGGDINDKFSVLRETNAIASLMSDSNMKFIGLFSQNDREYKAIYEKPVGTDIWKGYVTPSNYSEPYKASPYPISLSITDGIPTLSEFDFLDDNGNLLKGNFKLIKLIALILYKLGLNMPISSGVNKFSEGMLTASINDPLDQTFIDVESFYDEESIPMRCDEVITGILRPLGAKIIAYNGMWNIVEVETTDAYPRRIFSSSGDYVSNDTYDPIIEIVKKENKQDGLIFRDSDHVLEIIPAYGEMIITLDLNPFESIFERSMRNWQPNYNNASGSYGVLYEVDKDNRIVRKTFPGWRGGIRTDDIVEAPFANPVRIEGIEFLGLDKSESSQLPNGQGYVRVASDIFSITSKSDSIKFEFDYKVDMMDDRYRGQLPPWVRVSWQLILKYSSTTLYYSENLRWTTDNIFNSIYVDNIQSVEFKNLSTEVKLPVFSTPTQITLQFVIQCYGDYSRDFLSTTELRAIPTTTLPSGHKLKGIRSGDMPGPLPDIPEEFKFVELTNGTEADDYVNVIRPNDYDETTNPVYWAVNPARGFRPVKSISIQKPIFEYLPNGRTPIKSQTTRLVNNKNFKEKLDIRLICGDLPEGLSKELYKNYFKLSNGTPTKNWSRVGFSESTSLQQMLMKSFGNQYSKPSWKISGSFNDESTEWGFINTIKHTIEGENVSIEDDDFSDIDTPSDKWENFGIGTTWLANAEPKPQAQFISVSQDSKYYIQSDEIEIPTGARLSIEILIERTDSDPIELRSDRFVLVLFKDGVVVQSVTIIDNMYYDDSWSKVVRFNALFDADHIGFYVQNIDGISGNATYVVRLFKLRGLSLVKYFDINALSINNRDNKRTAELYQIIPTTFSSDPDIDDGDSGGGGSGGGSFSGAFSNGWSSGSFDTILN